MVDSQIPAITTDQMREVDRLMIDEFGIALMQMMENAGRNLAALARSRFLDAEPAQKRVVVLAGKGGNGGGGLVAARRLSNWGAQVYVFTTYAKEQFRGIPAHQLSILEKMGVPVMAAESVKSLPDADLLLDALIGYSLSGPPRGTAAQLIKLANQSKTPILSLDTPSGLDTTTGEPHQPHITANVTLTLALPKTGLMADAAQDAVGELYLADISVPSWLYAKIGLDVGPIFAKEDIIKIF